MKFLLIFLILANFGSPTKFKAWGNLECYQGGTWCFFAQMIERDHFFKDDILDTMGARCTTAVQYPYELAGSEDGDEPFHSFYKVTIKINHNCTQWGRIRSVEKKPKFIPVEQGKAEFKDVDIDLTMAPGTYTDSFFD